MERENVNSVGFYKVQNRASSDPPPFHPHSLTKTMSNAHVCKKFLVNTNGYFSGYRWILLTFSGISRQEENKNITTLQVESTQRWFALKADIFVPNICVKNCELI